MKTLSWRTAWWAFYCLLAVTLASGQTSTDQTPTPLRITLSARSIQPGEVVRVDVNAPADLKTVTGTVFGRRIGFTLDGQRHVWNALVGIDLGAMPGSYSLKIGTATETLRVLPKTFPARRLIVPEGFVNPPPEALEQIAGDTKKTERIFARVTPRRWAGAFILPADGNPTSNFGTRSYFNSQRRSPHAGVDFLNGTGAPIRASNHGVVVLAEPLYFTGNTVIVDYGDGLYSLFAHLSAFRVSAGALVEPDTIVGLVGATGRVTGPHLHWSVLLQGARVDPMSLVAATK
jgi:murein DD-endopeptidase MepM/ murein hydrolase activator NlpD